MWVKLFSNRKTQSCVVNFDTNSWHMRVVMRRLVLWGLQHQLTAWLNWTKNVLTCLRTKELPLLKTWGKKSKISFDKYLSWLQTSGPGLLYCSNTCKMLLEHLLMPSSVPTSVMAVVQRCRLPMAQFLTYPHTNVLLKIWIVHLASQISWGQE